MFCPPRKDAFFAKIGSSSKMRSDRLKKNGDLIDSDGFCSTLALSCPLGRVLFVDARGSRCGRSRMVDFGAGKFSGDLLMVCHAMVQEKLAGFEVLGALPRAWLF